MGVREERRRGVKRQRGKEGEGSMRGRIIDDESTVEAA